MPFCALTSLAPPNGMHLPKVLVVAPLSVIFPFFCVTSSSDCCLHFRSSLPDRVNARHVALEHGPFDLERNISYVIEMMERLGNGLNVMALCQGAVPALLATAHLAEKSQESAPRTLVLVAAPVDPAEDPDARRSPDHGAIPFLVRAQRHCSGTAAISGKRPSHLPWFCPAPGPAGLPSRHLYQGGEPQKTLQDDGEDPLRFRVPRPLYDFDGLNRRNFSTSFATSTKNARSGSEILARGQQVDFTAVRSTALMTVEGEDDDVAAPGQTRRAPPVSIVPARSRRQLVVPACGHFSLFHGGVWRTRVLPEVQAFMDRFARTGSGVARLNAYPGICKNASLLLA